jgi:hypothetical protein
MIQTCLLFFQLTGLLLLQLLSPGGFSVTPHYLSPVETGKPTTVELHIRRAAVNGFVKFEQEIPYGYRAKEVDVKGGKFLFAEQMVKITWNKFPSDSDFVIVYSLEASPGAPERARLKGSFSYLEDNSKVIYALPVSEVNLGKMPVIESGPYAAAAPGTEPPAAPANKQAKPTQPSAAGISCSREITNLTDKTVLVKVLIKNPDGLQGFAKLEDIIPTGFMAKLYESNGVSFSLVNSRARMIWMQVPAATEFFCSYKLIRIESDATTLDLEGTFSYVKDGETQNVPVTTPGIEFKAGDPAVAEKYKNPPASTAAKDNTPVAAKDAKTPSDKKAGNPASGENKSAGNKEAVAGTTKDNPSAAGKAPSSSAGKKGETTASGETSAGKKDAAGASKEKSAQESKSSPVQANSKADGKTAEKKNESSSKEQGAAERSAVQTETNTEKAKEQQEATEPVASRPGESGTQRSSSAAGVSFRVQVCAVRTMASTDAVARELSLSEAITPEMHEGWHKYTIGGFDTYEAAKTLRNRNSALPTGPFVTAYHAGSRITVQEALMITKQKWVK